MKQRVLLLIGDNLRHRYLLWRLLEANANIVGVVLQERQPDPVMKSPHSEEDQKALAFHFSLRDQTEAAYFGHCRDLSLKDRGIPEIRVGEWHINDPIVVRFSQEVRPDAIVVYGTRLLKEALMLISPGRILNLHLGLSPYYRGAATIFWPLYNDEPEYAGATIHLIDSTIDSGAIFHHVRPAIGRDDNPHTIGCKTVQIAAEGILRTLWELERGVAVAVPQWEEGQLYKQAQFQPRHARMIYEMLAEGLLDRYLERKDRVYYRMRLVG